MKTPPNTSPNTARAARRPAAAGDPTRYPLPATRYPAFLIIAIDGGAASGKSTTARALSERFHLLHVDTGSFYRAITAELLRQNLTPDDHPAIRATLTHLALGARVEGRTAHMEIDARPVDPGAIRTAEVNATVAQFAAIPEVRAALLDYQRAFAPLARAHANAFRGLVMEGRDIGSKIFPDADLRIFLHADPVERARRRSNEGLQDQVARRDALDNQRLLESAQGATIIDSTHLNLDQVVEKISALVAEKLQNPEGKSQRTQDSGLRTPDSAHGAATPNRKSKIENRKSKIP